MSTSDNPPAGGAGNTPRKEELSDQLLIEATAMARYAFAAGKEVPPAILGSIDPNDQAKLAEAHNGLAALVAPATPGTIRILEEEKKDGFGRYLGPIRLVRQLVIVALVFVAAFVAIATATDAGAEATKGGTLGRGLSSLAVVGYLLTAAGMGAVFAALFKLHRYVEEGTYDRTYDASYWILIVLGLIAGLLLAQFIPIKSVAGDATFSKPLLALLGGFAASAVHRILERLVVTLEALVRGDGSDEVKAARQQLAAERATQNRGLSRPRPNIPPA